VTPERIRTANDLLLRAAFRRYQHEHALMMSAREIPVPADATERGWDSL
jgi:hypothetical protein